MHTGLRTLITLMALAWPVVTVAAPGTIKNLSAIVENEIISLHWDPSAATDHIAYYRVYYSRKSIMSNQGKYDDYERTKSADPSATLKNFPKTPTLYIAVLAVDEKGVESSSFTEEVAVATGTSGGQSPPATPVPTLQKEMSPTSANTVDGGVKAMLEVLSVRAASQTGFVLTFSYPIMLSANDVGRAFSVTDGSGTALKLTRIRVSGAEVLLDTAPQKKGRVYQIRIGDVIRGKGTSSGKPMALNMEKDTILVMGFEGKESVKSTKVISPPTTPKKPTPPPMTAKVTTLPVRIPYPNPNPISSSKSKDLSNSGPGALLVLVSAGAVMGWRRGTRRRPVDNEQ